jgi:large subunit ribosomal protein L24
MAKNKLKIKKGDTVVVITGKDKGKKGVVQKVITSEMKLVVEGVNVAVKHTKPSQMNPQGGRLPKVMPIHYSNVQLVDPKLDMPTRVGYKMVDSKKVRFAKRSGEIMDNAN